MSISTYVSNVLAAVVNLYKTEPAVVISAASAVVVFVAASVGIVVDQTSVLSALAYIIPILVGGVAIRVKVSPVAKVVEPVTDPSTLPPDGVDGPHVARSGA